MRCGGESFDSAQDAGRIEKSSGGNSGAPGLSSPIAQGPALQIFASHPIQYLVPIYRELTRIGVDLCVGFYHQGAAGRLAFDPEFNVTFCWDVDLLGGYRHQVFVPGEATLGFGEQLRAAPRILYWCLRNKGTPMLLSGWFVGLAWVVWLARILSGGKTLILSETNWTSYLMRTRPAWRVRLLQWLLRHTSGGVFIGSRNRQFLADMGLKSNMFPALYSIDNEFFEREVSRLLPQRAELCQRYGLDPELPVFLFCGKLIPVKRPMDLLSAYLRADLGGKAQLLFVGDGQLRAELEREVVASNARGVRFIGFLNQSEMPLAYVLGEVLCLVSQSETWGLVVNEALASRRPTIVANTVGCGPDLVDSRNGWTFSVGDVDALARTLREAHELRDDWAVMGEAGRERVRRHTHAEMAKGIVAAAESCARVSGPEVPSRTGD